MCQLHTSVLRLAAPPVMPAAASMKADAARVAAVAAAAAIAGADARVESCVDHSFCAKGRWVPVPAVQ